MNLTVHGKQILFGVPQGYVPGHILFKIFLGGLFLTLNDIDITIVIPITIPL